MHATLQTHTHFSIMKSKSRARITATIHVHIDFPNMPTERFTQLASALGGNKPSTPAKEIAPLYFSSKSHTRFKLTALWSVHLKANALHARKKHTNPIRNIVRTNALRIKHSP